jgi:hypothetical protein
MADDEFSAYDSIGELESDIDTFGIDPAALGLELDGPDQNELNLTEEDFASNAEQEALAQQVRYQQFGYTWRFDDEAGDLQQSGHGHVKVEGLESFAEWVKSTLRTEKGRYQIYHDLDYGVDSEAVISGDVGPGIISGFLEDEIKEALSMHNRFIGIQDYTCDEGDTGTVTVAFTVLTSAGEIEITSDIGA